MSNICVFSFPAPSHIFLFRPHTFTIAKFIYIAKTATHHKHKDASLMISPSFINWPKCTYTVAAYHHCVPLKKCNKIKIKNCVLCAQFHRLLSVSLCPLLPPSSLLRFGSTAFFCAFNNIKSRAGCFEVLFEIPLDARNE